MGIKQLVSRKAKHIRRERQDAAEFKRIGSITDDKLRREVGSLVKDLKLVDSNYVKFVKKHSRFGKDGGKSEYNKQMLEKARTERVRSQIQRYQEAMREGLGGMAIAKIVGHVAINAVFNKQFRQDFLEEFKKPITKTAEQIAKAGGQASLTGKLMRESTHVPFDARSAALTELAQTLKFNEDMRNTKDPAKREWLTKSYVESLNALYDWAYDDGVPADSIRRMRNVMLDKDLQSASPKFSHLYENVDQLERDSQRLEFFEHLDSGVFVWEGDFRDKRTGEPFQFVVKTPEYGESLNYDVDKSLDQDGIDIVSDENALIDDIMAISDLEASDFDFDVNDNNQRLERIEDTSQSNDIIFDWSDVDNKAIPINSKNNDDVKVKNERSLEIGSWDDVAREVVRRRIPYDIAHDIVEQRFSPIIEKATWENVVDALTNQYEKPKVHLNGKYVHGNNGYSANELLQRQAEYQLVNDHFKGHLDKRLSITSEMVNMKKDGYNRLDLDLNSKDVNITYVTRERTRRQERLLEFEETKSELMSVAKKTPSLTDDELVAKLELSLADVGSGATLENDMKDFQIGD